jgi:hypothetical protein
MVMELSVASARNGYYAWNCPPPGRAFSAFYTRPGSNESGLFFLELLLIGASHSPVFRIAPMIALRQKRI